MGGDGSFVRAYAFIAAIVLFLYIWLFITLYSYVRASRRNTASTADPSLSNRKLDSSAINSLPTFKFSADAEGSSKKRSCRSECVVCLGEFEDDEMLRLMPSCGHFFHSQCVDGWLLSHGTCPYCRTVVSPPTGESPEVRIAVAPPPASS